MSSLLLRGTDKLLLRTGDSLLVRAAATETTGGVISVRSHVRPSYKTSFARSAAESASPHLWDGLSGAWCPALGNTGDTVRNIPRRQYGAALSGSTSWAVTQGEQSLDLNGSSDYLEVMDPELDNVVNGFTLTARVKLTSVKANNYLLSKHGVIGDESVSQWGLSCTNESGNYCKFYITKSNSLTVVFFSAPELNDTSEWHTVTLTYNNEARLFVDGSFSETQALSGDTDSDNGNLILGWFGRASTYLDGAIAATCVHDRVLSDDEVHELHRDPLAPFRRRITIPFATQADVVADAGPYYRRPLRPFIPGLVR